MPGKHIVFLVHGMGEFEKGWSKSAQALIRKHFDQYPQLGWLPFKDRFQFKEIVYNDEFKQVRDSWKQQQQSLAKVLGGLGITQGAIATLSKLAKVTEKDSFLNTHVLDVLLYRFVRQIGAAARDSVRSQILNELKKQAQSSSLSWSVVAHSLGTAVAHDALHELYTDRIGDMDQQLGQITRPRLVMMVANVSRVLQTFKKTYESLVSPGSPDGDHICRHYVNAHHEWDPFTLPKSFSPKDDWPTLEIRAKGLYRDVTTRVIEKVNVHDLNHYLRNPEVHIPMFHALIDTEVIDADIARNAHLKFVAQSPVNRFGEFVDELEQFRLGEMDSWTSTASAWRRFREAVGEGGQP